MTGFKHDIMGLKTNPKGIQSFGLGLGLRGRMAFWIVLIPMLPFLIIGLVCDQTMENGLQKKAQQQIKSAIGQTGRDVEKYFQEMKRLLVIQAKRPSSRSLLASLSEGFALSGSSPDVYVAGEDWQKRLNQWKTQNEPLDFWAYRNTLLTDVKGNVLYSLSNTDMLGKNIHEGQFASSPISKACHKVLRSGGAVFSDFGIYTERGDEHILGHMVTRMAGAGDETIGLVIFECQVSDINGILSGHQDLGQSFEMYLVGQDKLLRSDSGTRSTRKALKHKVASGLVCFPELGGKNVLHSTAESYQGPDGLTMIGMHDFVRIGDIVYELIGEMEERDNFTLLYQIRKAFWFFSIVQLIVVIAAAYILTGRVVRPVVNMADWASHVATGDLVLLDIESRDDELGQFVRNFSQVVVFLRETAILARSIASGDFNVNIEPRSAKDELGLALEQMTRSLREASHAMASLAGGDFDVKVKVKGPNDKFAISINSMVEKIKITHDANEKQAHMKSLQMELSKTIRGNQTIHELARRILSFFCNTFQASTGVFYLADSSEDVLRLVSSYACHHHLPEEIHHGVGLLGQAAREKEKIILNHCPDDYMAIHGLTGTKEISSVLVFPFVHESSLVAIMELGSLKMMTDKELEFIDQVSENVAIAIMSAYSRMKMKELLDKTVKQSEDLKTNQEKLDGINRALQMKTIHLQETEAQLRKQEVELRATNRDLIRQTEKLKKSEKRLRIKEEELMTVNTALEERSFNLEEQKNAIKRKNIQLESAQKELVEKSDRLENSSRYKSEFLANMSHELRTPLNSILLISRLLTENKAGNLSEKQVEFSHTILTSGMDLLTLIDDILDLSKIESGKLELQISRASITEMVEKIEAGFSPVCQDKGIGFSIDVDERVSDSVYLDFQRTDQVLKNLVGNAIKFTSQGQVTVAVTIPDTLPEKLKKRFKKEETLLVSVKDSGVGIPKDKLSVIFDAFKQADGTINRQFGGTGLGLSISLQLIRLMGGDIIVDSEPGVGSTFHVYLPHVFVPPDNLSESDEAVITEGKSPIAETPTEMPGKSKPEKTPESANQPERQEKEFKGKKIMVVDDDMRNVFALINYLEDYGMDIKVARSGKESLAVLEKNPDIDLVVMDIMMPEMGGYEAMERIRAQERFKALPMIALTAKAMKGDLEKCLEAGASDYLSKPVDMDRLLMLMKNMLIEQSE